MDTEKKFAPVETIEYYGPQQTTYGKALTMNWFGKASPDASTTGRGLAVRIFAILGALFGGMFSIFGGIDLATGRTLTFLWIGPALLVTSFAVLHICSCVTGRENKKLLSDPTETFHWQIARTAKSFNDRVKSYNAILAAVQLGKVSAPENELAYAYKELSSAREELNLNIKMLEGMRNIPNTEPELAANLEELRDAKKVLMYELRQSEYPNEALPAGKIREALQNERAYRELPLLSEAKK